jgi:hypothetical protein
MEDKTENLVELKEKISILAEIDDMTWGNYAISRDFLRDRIPLDQRERMIKEAIACGEKYADIAFEETGEREPDKIAQKLSLQVVEKNQPMTEKRALFAQFTEPDLVELMTEPMKKYEELLSLEDTEQEGLRLPSLDKVHNLILAHEIFHYYEGRDEATIYTRNEKIHLWSFWKWHNDSTIRALGEIAAMTFSRKINNTLYSPFLLDVLLYWGYNRKGANSIYNDIITFLNRQE